MTSIDQGRTRIGTTPFGGLALSPTGARMIIIVVIAAAAGAGVASTFAGSAAAAAAAGADLTRLLRFMAAIKAVAALAAGGAVLWRLGVPVSPSRLLAYGIACAAMMLGPGLIWGMVHVGSGALLLHGGLLAVVLMLWNDPAVTARLDTMLKRRRARSYGPTTSGGAASARNAAANRARV